MIDRARITGLFKATQDQVCSALSQLTGDGFAEQLWDRPGGGGGRSRLCQNGQILERAGVNFSEVEGELPEAASGGMPGSGRRFYATGVSLVIHPRNPYAPTAHANFRYFERGDTWWFGGGADLTPHYLFEEDAQHFHGSWKAVCDRSDPRYYPQFKKGCDDYFLIPHRNERRGIGGLFYDYLVGDDAPLFELQSSLACNFVAAYLPLLERRHTTPYGERERQWQLYRRGRYVEFNLVYDRGTVFGLKTDGRVESILMSMPPLARWETIPEPEASTPEGQLLAVLREPREWCSP
jgi:coproporphyrinogen III oxidase